MLKYIVTLSIISFCYSTPSSQLHNDVHQVVFIQGSPVTAYKVLKEKLLLTKDKNTQRLTNHLRLNGWNLLEIPSNRFIIYALLGLNSSNQPAKYCKDANGNAWKYSNAPLTDDFKNYLKRYWPSIVDKPVSMVWKVVYDIYGSCVSHSRLNYYQTAISLHDKYNVGELLRNVSIQQRNSISYDHLISVLAEELRVRPIIGCETFQTGQSSVQFLHEVHICLNTSYELIDCTYTNEVHCNQNKSILYPAWLDL